MKTVKQLILLIFILLCVASCNAQNTINKQSKNITTNMELNNVLNSDFETFDIQWLKENTISETPSGKFIDYRYKKDSTDYFILLAGNDRSGYYSFYYDNNSYYFLYKTFYVNGKIQEKGRMFNSTANGKVGKWYLYNEAGDLVKVEDYDKHFAFTFDDAIQYCLDHNIPLEKGSAPRLKSSSATTINRRYLPTQDSSVYTIEYYIGGMKYVTITLDGNTGKELSREEWQMKGA